MDFSTRRIKLELDCTVAGSWCEIDAIKIKGKQHIYGKVQLLTYCLISVKLDLKVLCYIYSHPCLVYSAAELLSNLSKRLNVSWSELLADSADFCIPLMLNPQRQI